MPYINPITIGATTSSANTSWGNYSAATATTNTVPSGSTLISSDNGVYWASTASSVSNYNTAIGYNVLSSMVSVPISKFDFKCIGTEFTSVKDDRVLIPIFSNKVDIGIRIAIGVFANKSFCKEFTEKEYKYYLIEFSEIFMNQLQEDDKLIYSESGFSLK